MANGSNDLKLSVLQKLMDDCDWAHYVVNHPVFSGAGVFKVFHLEAQLFKDKITRGRSNYYNEFIIMKYY